MKKLLFHAALIMCLLFSYNHLDAQQGTAKDEFLYAIVELHKTDVMGQYAVDIKLAHVINKKLKSPTKSDKIELFDPNYVSFQITDDDQNILDEIHLKDPLSMDVEYVSSDGSLSHTTVQRENRAILIRRPISKRATHISVQPHSKTRSQNSTTLKFRKS